jgi:hypothetical protein
MRNVASIDAELRLFAAARRLAQAYGTVPTTEEVDALLDERAKITADASRRTRYAPTFSS